MPVAKRPGRRSDAIYEALRQEIVTGELRPNQPLIEVDLAAKLDVSRTPVRESLQRLVISGLVVPRKRGWAVREFSAEQMQENAEVRAGLEGYAAALAAERGSDEALRAIAERHESRLALRADDEALRVRTNRDFHDAVILAAGNTRLMDVIYSLGQFYFNRPIARLATGDELTQGNADHAKVVSALLARDGPAAERAMRAHILRTFLVYGRISEFRPSHVTA